MGLQNIEAIISNLQSTPLTRDEVLPELFLIIKTAPKKLRKVVWLGGKKKHILDRKQIFLNKIKKLKGLSDASITAHVKKCSVKHLD